MDGKREMVREVIYREFILINTIVELDIYNPYFSAEKNINKQQIINKYVGIYINTKIKAVLYSLILENILFCSVFIFITLYSQVPQKSLSILQQ